jgi:hypothetical protein
MGEQLFAPELQEVVKELIDLFQFESVAIDLLEAILQFGQRLLS